MTLHATVRHVTDRIVARSTDTRARYLAQIEHDRKQGPTRAGMSCTNLAHAFAAAPVNDKLMLREERRLNIGIVSAYNDMLSAHQPFERFPGIIKQAARDAGGVAQFAGGVPAMCDGVTQGAAGMELSLFSRDVIALSTAVALSHNVFDAMLCLGVCDKIVPGLLIGALKFGHLPGIFVPAGPMTSGLPNDEKAKIRQRFSKGEVTREALLEAESQAYHDAGTCTFYGTANSNQMLMEIMGVHLPGAAFVNPNTPLRDALTAHAAKRVLALADRNAFTPLGHVIDEKAIVNGIVGLHATGGSTNHTIHLVAMAKAAGILINWDDFAELSNVVPLLARIYPNGSADVNHFHASGGMGFLIRELLAAGLLHEDVQTVAGPGLSHYSQEPFLEGDKLVWRDAPAHSGDENVLRVHSQPFSDNGGLKVLEGNIGRAVLKVSAVKPEHRIVRAPAAVYDSQEDVLAAYKRNELNRDVVVVVRYQGPRANGMPELHKLTPALGVLQDEGFHVALVTDGRMSGASGKVPAAIHVSPEGLGGGLIAHIRDGDMMTVDGEAGVLHVDVDAATLAARDTPDPDLSAHASGIGRELFGFFRNNASEAEQGASPML
ncbi:phosphogluconate dehydratase [Alcaligenaceae bacterium C4P045]|nr:phosphogluconate dehydratase [Alcaligenaceae bacterium B3P038]MDQ2147808.1 phosphogluconate dehydratase [Alcaligenaceae bacterium C4P045]